MSVVFQRNGKLAPGEEMDSQKLPLITPAEEPGTPIGKEPGSNSYSSP